MTQYLLRASSRTVADDGLRNLGLEMEPGEFRKSGRVGGRGRTNRRPNEPSSTIWGMTELTEVYENHRTRTEVDPFGNTVPVRVRVPGLHMLLTWNGDDPTPYIPSNFTIVWSSDMEEEMPAGEWPMIL